MSTWKPRVLVAEDDSSMRRILEFNLVEEGFEVELATTGDADQFARSIIKVTSADRYGIQASDYFA